MREETNTSISRATHWCLWITWTRHDLAFSPACGLAHRRRRQIGTAGEGKEAPIEGLPKAAGSRPAIGACAQFALACNAMHMHTCLADCPSIKWHPCSAHTSDVLPATLLRTSCRDIHAQQLARGARLFQAPPAKWGAIAGITVLAGSCDGETARRGASSKNAPLADLAATVSVAHTSFTMKGNWQGCPVDGQRDPPLKAPSPHKHRAMDRCGIGMKCGGMGGSRPGSGSVDSRQMASGSLGGISGGSRRPSRVRASTVDRGEPPQS